MKDLDNKQSILQEADSIVNGARKADYGSAKVSFERIGQMTALMLTEDEWESLKQRIIPPTVVTKMHQATKLTRESFAHKRDNLVDLAGYASLQNDILE